jgi:two-component system chemotaxis response regulator CheY
MQGFEVITASDGMDALEKLPKGKVDLIITDLNMPNMDGYELIRTLRESNEYRELPVIILSSLSDKRAQELGLEAGAHSYLVKPFSIEKVQYEVSKFLSWSDETE